MSPSNPIRIAAVILKNHDGEILSVRKAGTSAFMLPGGKLEPGEDPMSTAIREISEELHLELIADELDHLGRFSAPAANEAGRDVDCDVFVSAQRLDRVPEVFEEIEEAAYFPADSTSTDLAPLSLAIFPML
ncbi:hypothetical protein CDES_05275 [Corynebacterium deserti GIMN1.010]|uniref:Nudix hydrolase domain-containing protein n=1 Tax=Corynebacterium deserti GIMN1.010 TaxID=931089 RepID=A0A0M4CPA0_9CORY|nr:hypothetical protein CDES_05275 [Corynebacterium deserti GIMN1.010]